MDIAVVVERGDEIRLMVAVFMFRSITCALTNYAQKVLLDDMKLLSKHQLQAKLNRGCLVTSRLSTCSRMQNAGQVLALSNTYKLLIDLLFTRYLRVV